MLNIFNKITKDRGKTQENKKEKIRQLLETTEKARQNIKNSIKLSRNQRIQPKSKRNQKAIKAVHTIALVSFSIKADQNIA